MAQNNLDINLLINTTSAANSIKDIRKGILELRNAALQVGEGGKGFNDLVSAAGKLQDKLNDIKETTTTLSGNVVENLTRSFSVFASSAIGGFQALQGAQAAFGNDSKDLQKTLVQLQGLMALTNGIKEFANIGKAYSDFNDSVKSGIKWVISSTTAREVETVAIEENTIAVEANNAAMLANPITAVIAAILALSAAYLYFKNRAEEARKTNAELNASYLATFNTLNEQTSSIDKLNNSIITAARGQSNLKSLLEEQRISYETSKKSASNKYTSDIDKLYATNQVQEYIGADKENKDKLAKDKSNKDLQDYLRTIIERDNFLTNLEKENAAKVKLIRTQNEQAIKDDLFKSSVDLNKLRLEQSLISLYNEDTIRKKQNKINFNSDKAELDKQKADLLITEEQYQAKLKIIRIKYESEELQRKKDKINADINFELQTRRIVNDTNLFIKGSTIQTELDASAERQRIITADYKHRIETAKGGAKEVKELNKELNQALLKDTQDVNSKIEQIRLKSLRDSANNDAYYYDILKKSGIGATSLLLSSTIKSINQQTPDEVKGFRTNVSNELKNDSLKSENTNVSLNSAAGDIVKLDSKNSDDNQLLKLASNNGIKINDYAFGNGIYVIPTSLYIALKKAIQTAKNSDYIDILDISSANSKNIVNTISTGFGNKSIGDKISITKQIEQQSLSQNRINQSKEILNTFGKSEDELTDAEKKSAAYNEIISRYAKERVDIEQKTQDDIFNLRKDRNDSYLSIAGDLVGSLGSLWDTFISVQDSGATVSKEKEEQRAKERFNIQKALTLSLAVLQAPFNIMNAWEGIAKSGGDPLKKAIAIANLVAVSAANVANIAKIAASQYKGSSTGASQVVSNPVNLYGNSSQLNNLTAKNDNTNQQIRFYVLESDITSTQGNMERYRGSSRLG